MKLVARACQPCGFRFLFKLPVYPVTLITRKRDNRTLFEMLPVTLITCKNNIHNRTLSEEIPINVQASLVQGSLRMRFLRIFSIYFHFYSLLQPHRTPGVKFRILHTSFNFSGPMIFEKIFFIIHFNVKKLTPYRSPPFPRGHDFNNLESTPSKVAFT